MTRYYRPSGFAIHYYLVAFVLIIVTSTILTGCTNLPLQQMTSQTPSSITPTIDLTTQSANLDRLEKIPDSAVKMTPGADPLPPILHSDEYQPPVPMPGLVNTAGAEDSPFITPDGKTLYFFFTPDLSVAPEKQLLDKVTGIYITQLQRTIWSQADRVVLQSSGKLALDGCPFVLNTSLWFCSAREGFDGVKLFTAQYMDGKWRNWQSADNLNKTDYQIGEIHITADGKTLYFHSARSGGQGQFDIWVTKFINGVWQEPVNVAPVNSPESEGWPFVSQDGNELWFTRTYLGSPAIFRSLWTGDTWSTPMLVISQFAGEPTLDNQRNLYFVHHFIKEGKIIEADLYVAYRR